MNAIRQRLKTLWASPRGKIVVVAIMAAIVGLVVAARRGSSSTAEPVSAAAGETYYNAGAAAPVGDGIVGGGTLGDGGWVDPYTDNNTAGLWEEIASITGVLDSQQGTLEAILASGSGAGAAAQAPTQPTGTTSTQKQPVKPAAKVKAGFFRSANHWYYRNSQGNYAAVSAPPKGATIIAAPAGFKPAQAAQPNRPAEPAKPTPAPTPQNPSPTKPAQVKAGFFRTANHWYYRNANGAIAKAPKGPPKGATVIPTPTNVRLPK